MAPRARDLSLAAGLPWPLPSMSLCHLPSSVCRPALFHPPQAQIPQHL